MSIVGNNVSTVVGPSVGKRMSAAGGGGPTTGLIAYYALDETVTGNRTDSHDSNLTLTQSGTTNAVADGKQGYAASFISAQAGILTSTDSSFVMTGDMSAAFWFRRTATATNQGMFGKNVNKPGESAYMCWWDTGGKIAWYMKNDAATPFQCQWSTTPTLNVWYHAAMTFKQSTGAMKLVINDTTTITNTMTGTFTDMTNTALFYLGYYGSGSFLTGDLDEFGIWNQELTADEITFLYKGGAGRAYTDL